jgi:hypothetical protein
MKKLINWLTWLDNNLLKILITLFIFVIPLYPKLPLKLIEYTYIAVRLDDIYVGFVVAVFFIQLLRGKVKIDRYFLILFITFWAAVFASFAVGYFLQHTLRQQLFQIGLLHSGRRVQYMIFFFIGFTTVKKKEDLLFYVRLIFIVLLLVTLYGMGQKFLGWPAIQTMNPAFARGALLYLTPEARISSTFGGHYDLAAYLVLLIPFVVAMYFYSKNIFYYVVAFLSIFALTLTASRISFIAYIGSMGAFLLYTRKFKHLIIIGLITIGLTFVSTNLTSRFFQTFQIKQVFVNEKTGQTVLPQLISSKELPAGGAYIPIQNDVQPTVNPATAKLLKEELLDQVQKEATKSGRVLTASEAAQIVATMSADLRPVNTISADISNATRLQVEWPRAINALKRNPLFGTGPASITESTDNDYLRWLGEFGLIGTSIFLFIIFNISVRVFNAGRKKDKTAILYTGFLFGTLGLLLNASYIDVFEASKVAYYFWLLSGIIIATLALHKSNTA